MRKFPLLFFVLFVTASAWAQSIVWHVDLAGQRRELQSLDDRVRLIMPEGAAERMTIGKPTALGNVIKSDKHGVVVSLPKGATLREAIDRPSSVGASEVAPMFTEKGEAGREYTLTKQILITAPDEHAARVAAAAAGAESFHATVAPGRWMLVFRNARAVLDAYPALIKTGVDPQPQFRQPVFRKTNDPLFPMQWHLKNTGQAQGVAGIDANVEPVWGTGNRGAGQVISIIDDGLQVTYPDLSPNALPVGGDFQTSNHWNFSADPQNNNPADLGQKDDHGTSCGGVAAGKGDNNLGITGSAPDASLIGLRLIAGDITDENASAALGWRPAIVTISSNSWGYDDDNSVSVSGPDTLAQAALLNGVTQGRGGRGIIYTVAGGNGGTPNYRDKGPGIDESNYDGFANSPYTIAVGGNNDKGVQNFSEQGCNLVLTAPTGGEGTDQNITTTTLMGQGNIPGFPDYTNSFGGTSSSTPLVSGVIALMLTANAQLGWRDVQEILIRSSRKIDNEDASWHTNGAGVPFRFSNRYGAGMVDAAAAVNLATSWKNLPAQTSETRSSTTSQAIPDNNASGAVASFDFSGTNLRVEQVQFTVVSPPFARRTGIHPYLSFRH